MNGPHGHGQIAFSFYNSLGGKGGGGGGSCNPPLDPALKIRVKG